MSLAEAAGFAEIRVEKRNDGRKQYEICDPKSMCRCFFCAMVLPQGPEPGHPGNVNPTPGGSPVKMGVYLNTIRTAWA